MNWLIFALLAAIIWGVAQVLVKKGFSESNPFFNNILATIFTLLIFVPYSLSQGVNWNLFPQIFLLAIPAMLPNYIYYYALEKGDISLTGTIVAAYPMITVLLSILLLRELITVPHLIGVALVIVGAFLISKPRKFNFKFEPWVAWGAAAAVIIGFGDFMGKVGLTKFDQYTFFLAFSLSAIPSFFITALFDNHKVIPNLKLGQLIPTLSGTFLIELGLLFLYLALASGPVSIVSPVSSAYVAITVILASIFLREKVNQQQAIGIGATVIGIIVLGF